MSVLKISNCELIFKFLLRKNDYIVIFTLFPPPPPPGPPLLQQ
jgi:hypothetical protein